MTDYTPPRSVGFWLAMLFTIGILLAVLFGAMATAAAAPAGSPVMVNAPNGTPNGSDRAVIEQVDPSTRVTGQEFTNGSLVITIESDFPKSITIAQGVTEEFRDQRSGRMPIRTYDLDRGTNRIRFGLRSGTDRESTLVTLTTPQSREAGHYSWLTPEPAGGGILQGDPSMRVVWAAGLSAMLATALLVYRLLKRDREDGPRVEAERA